MGHMKNPFMQQSYNSAIKQLVRPQLNDISIEAADSREELPTKLLEAQQKNIRRETCSMQFKI